ncbi:MAG: hypothetical protein IPQ07_39940 [Myxococcales bacterium]|nr:hypothetical protein [Myxococcales bacterium]
MREAKVLEFAGETVTGRLVRSVASPEFTCSAPAAVRLPAELAAQLEAAGAFVRGPVEVLTEEVDVPTEAERAASAVLGGVTAGEEEKVGDVGEKEKPPAAVRLPAELALQLDAAGAFVRGPVEVLTEEVDVPTEAERAASAVLGGVTAGEEEKVGDVGEEEKPPEVPVGGEAEVEREVAPKGGETAARHGKGRKAGRR